MLLPYVLGECPVWTFAYINKKKNLESGSFFDLCVFYSHSMVAGGLEVIS